MVANFRPPADNRPVLTPEVIRGYRVWDLHTHMTGVSGASPEARMAALMAFADRMGIERVCLYMGTTLTRDPSPERLRFENNQVIDALKGWEQRALGFVYLNPKHVRASLAELERFVAGAPVPWWASSSGWRNGAITRISIR
jgi:hypothetical protein